MREMKDSGVEWIGAIPIDWKTIKLKYLISIHSGESISNEQLIEDGAYEVYGGGEAIGLCNTFNTKASDILVGRVGARCGCVSYPQNNVWATDNALVISSNCNPTFLYYMLDSMKLNRLNTSNAQPLITGAKIKNSFIPFIFDKNEQTRIIDFLDNKCAQIDSIIDDIYHQFVILQEYKQSVITEAVTKGLDKNVAMKDSGIAWVGKIPAHWDFKKIKYCTEIRDESGIFNPETDTYIGLENIEGFTATYIETTTEYETSKQSICKKGDIMFSKLRPYLGKILLCPFDGFCTGELLQFKSFVGEPLFLKYWLLNNEFIKNVDASTYGAKMPRANTPYIINLKIPLPPISEQQEIAVFLEDICAKIDATIIEKQKQLDTLTEYKKSLIYEYVTGKKEVPADA
ncbi:MAG: restriction endonuclease subunit S [Selenomonadaceae bacterium]|nr:restriction endonuclease subunit S [Selenomonadaceae bacterium]